jgi:uncharacterized tellurite resistance protein B-like protein
MTDWFQNLKGILNRYEPADDPRALPRAAAALMLEMALTDREPAAAELEIIHAAMRQTFAIDELELVELLDQAHQAQAQSVSLYEFTRDLKNGLDNDQRAELVEWMWRVAHADSRLDVHEEHLVRRTADLLGVPHHEYIRRKLIVQGG